MTIVASPEPNPTDPVFRFALPTADADAFLDTLTAAEARSMLRELLGRDEGAFITAMRRVERTRARYAEAVAFRPCYEHGYVDCGCPEQAAQVTR